MLSDSGSTIVLSSPEKNHVNEERPVVALRNLIGRKTEPFSLLRFPFNRIRFLKKYTSYKINWVHKKEKKTTRYRYKVGQVPGSFVKFSALKILKARRGKGWKGSVNLCRYRWEDRSSVYQPIDSAEV